MLICYHNGAQLPPNDLVYFAFLSSLHETVAEIESSADFDDDEEEMPAGFLTAVPFLHPVPLCVQVELLGETWSRHSSSTRFEATLLDAAVVYSAFMVAIRIISDEPDLAEAWLADDRRELDPQILQHAPEQLDDLFDRWWDDRDFLMLEEFHDLPPEQAKSVKALMRIPDEMIQPMFDVLERGRVSTEVGEKLEELLPPKDIQHIVPILMRRPNESRWSTENDTEDDVESSLEWGLEDDYHGLLVGPCDPDMIEKETDCPFMCEIGTDAESFDCTYEEWSMHLRDAVHRASAKSDFANDSSTADGDNSEKGERTQGAGLKGGDLIERHERGWVIADDTDCYLADAERAIWVVGDDDEDMPPLYFDTAEAALLAYDCSLRAAELRAQRRKEALERLGKSDDR